MKVAKSATIRVSTRPVHQIQFDEGSDDYMSQKTSDVKKRYAGFAVCLVLFNSLYMYFILCVLLLIDI